MGITQSQYIIDELEATYSSVENWRMGGGDRTPGLYVVSLLDQSPVGCMQTELYH